MIALWPDGIAQNDWFTRRAPDYCGEPQHVKASYYSSHVRTSNSRRDRGQSGLPPRGAAPIIPPVS
jgi:hypothetical protein